MQLLKIPQFLKIIGLLFSSAAVATVYYASVPSTLQKFDFNVAPPPVPYVPRLSSFISTQFFYLNIDG